MDFKKKMKMEEMDDSILDELIGKCEHAMVSPLKKNKEVEVSSKMKAEPEEEEEGEEEYASNEDEESSDLSEEDRQKLLEIYSKLKG